MKLPRIIALLVAPAAALSLAACGGGSTAGIANASGNTANVRFVNGTPGQGAFDVYFQSSGSAAPTTPLVSNVAYAVASDYLTQPAVAATILVQVAGGPAPGGAAQRASCPIPQLASNGKYSIVIVSAQSTLNCQLFQDFDYASAPQYRVHDASPNAGAIAAGGLGYGVIAASNAPPGTPFSVQGTAAPGNLAATPGGSAQSYTQVQPNALTASAGSVTFAVGAATSGTPPSIATIDSKYVFAPNGTTQPNTSGVLNVAGTAGTSIFALDCTPGAIAAVPHAACSAGGTTLVGYTDRL